MKKSFQEKNSRPRVGWKVWSSGGKSWGTAEETDRPQTRCIWAKLGESFYLHLVNNHSCCSAVVAQVEEDWSFKTKEPTSSPTGYKHFSLTSAFFHLKCLKVFYAEPRFKPTTFWPMLSCSSQYTSLRLFGRFLISTVGPFWRPVLWGTWHPL